MQSNQDKKPANERRSENLGVVVSRIEDLKSDMSDLKETFRESAKELSKVIQELVRITERQMALSQTSESIREDIKLQSEEIRKIDARLDAVEKRQPMNDMVTGWITKAVWGAVVLLAMFAAKFMGLM